MSDTMLIFFTPRFFLLLLLSSSGRADRSRIEQPTKQCIQMRLTLLFLCYYQQIIIISIKDYTHTVSDREREGERERERTTKSALSSCRWYTGATELDHTPSCRIRTLCIITIEWSENIETKRALRITHRPLYRELTDLRQTSVAGRFEAQGKTLLHLIQCHFSFNRLKESDRNGLKSRIILISLASRRTRTEFNEWSHSSVIKTSLSIDESFLFQAFQRSVCRNAKSETRTTW